MTLTEKEKSHIRSYWSNYTLQFKSDGTVLAKKRPESAWGILYHPRDTVRHLQAVGLRQPE